MSQFTEISHSMFHINLKLSKLFSWNSLFDTIAFRDEFQGDFSTVKGEGATLVLGFWLKKNLVRPIRDNHKQNADKEKRNLNPVKSIIRAVGVKVNSV